MAIGERHRWKPHPATAALFKDDPMFESAWLGVRCIPQQLETKMTTKKATAKKATAKKAAGTDGKARKSVASIVVGALERGERNTDKIIARALAAFPDRKPTRGYVNMHASKLGIRDEMVVTSKPSKVRDASE